MLYNHNYASLLLGCLMQNTNLLFSPSYPLSRSDFSPEPFHKVVFVAIVKIAETGANAISEVEVDNFLQNYPKQYELFNDNNGMEFVSTVVSLAKLESYEHYYTNIRKFSLLRDLQAQGYDIKRYYDEMLDDTSQNANLNKFTIKDILNEIETKQSKLRNKYDVEFIKEEMVAGEDTEELLKEFETQPSFGAFRSSPYLTQLFLGLNKGHFQLHSAPAGTAKTRMSVMDLCYLSCKYLWDIEANEYRKNLNYCGAGLFIATEMNLRREINPIFLACVSAVPSNKITQGLLTKEEKERVKQAGQILTDSKLILCDMPDFNSKSIEEKIKECVEQYGVENVVFDYLQLNSSLAEEFKIKNAGVPAREDLILRGLATDLKSYAEKYNVRIISSSQLNGHEKEMDFPDESCLSSSKAIKQKLDGGVIYMSAKEKPKDIEMIQPYLKRKGFGDNQEEQVNLIGYVYKSRFGLYADQKIKIFSYFDRGIMRIKDYVITDNYNNLVNIPKPVLKEQVEETEDF